MVSFGIGLFYRVILGGFIGAIPDSVFCKISQSLNNKLSCYFLASAWRLGFDGKFSLCRQQSVGFDLSVVLGALAECQESRGKTSVEKNFSGTWTFDENNSVHSLSGACENMGYTVSIVIASNRDFSRVRRALQSVAQQCYQQLEVILVRDGTNDDLESTNLLIEEFKDMHLKILQNEYPRGVYDSRNRGIKASSGDFITFMDDDDESEPSRIHSQLLQLQKSGKFANVCLSYSHIESKRVLGDSGTTIQPCLASFMFDLKKGEKPLYEPGAVASDTLLATKLFIERGRIPVCASPLYRVNIEEGSLSRGVVPVRRWLPNRRDWIYLRFLTGYKSSINV